jgi:hypothetical protein
MLEQASSRKTKSVPRKQQQPKFQFHIIKDMQKQLPITTQRSYSNTAAIEATPTKKQTVITQPITRKEYRTHNQEQQPALTQETVPTQTTQ